MSISLSLALALTLLLLTTGCTSSQQVQSAIPSPSSSEPTKTAVTPGQFKAQAPNGQSLTTVISIGDGDTLRVRQNGEIVTVRAACTDAV